MTPKRDLPAPPWRDLETLAATWRAMIEAREEQVRHLLTALPPPPQDFWSSRAAEFRARLAQEEPDALFVRLRSFVDADTTVLDVGAGVGRYALRIASHVRQVVAVEPAEGMRQVLREEAEARGLRNIRVVAAAWQEAEVERADVVICSHVVYGVLDIVGFVRKLREHAARTVLMAVRIDQFDSYVRDLWLELHGEPRGLEPTFIELSAILAAMGVAPNVDVIHFAANRSFATWEEAENRVAQLGDTPPDRLEVARRYARERLRANADGTWGWAAPPIRSAIAWWNEPSV